MRDCYKILATLCTFILVSANVFGQTETLKVWIDENVNVVADGKTVNVITVYEDDPNATYSAYEVCLRLPKGLTLATYDDEEEQDVVWLKKSERCKTTHNLSYGFNDIVNDDEHKKLKVTCSNLKSQTFYSPSSKGTYALCEVGLIADPDMEIGDYEIVMHDACFVYQDPNYATYLNGTIHTATASVVKPMSIDYTMTAAGAGTLIVPFDCEVPSGLVVSVCSSVGNDNYVVQEAAASIKAFTPYFVEGRAGTYTLTGNVGVVDETQTYTEGVLVGVLQETQPPVGSYLLQNHNGKVAFYQYKDNNTLKVSPNRCYLNTGSGTTNTAVYIKGLADGISAATDNGMVDVYNTQGVLLHKHVPQGAALEHLPAGVYIVNGVKCIKR